MNLFYIIASVSILYLASSYNPDGVPEPGATDINSAAVQIPSTVNPGQTTTYQDATSIFRGAHF